MDTIYYIVLIPMVYVAFAVFLIGSCVRLISIFKTPNHPSSLQIFPEKKPKWLWALRDTIFLPSVFKHKPALWFFLMMFHVSFFFMFIGHIELIAPPNIFQVIEHDIFLGKGYIGLILSVCLIFFLFRRFISPYRELSVPEDYYFLILLFLTVLFGSQLDWARRLYGYEELSVEGYREYLLGILSLKPALSVDIMNSGHSFVLVLHVFFANLFLMFFPFSKITHSFFSLAMNKLKRG